MYMFCKLVSLNVIFDLGVVGRGHTTEIRASGQKKFMMRAVLISIFKEGNYVQYTS